MTDQEKDDELRDEKCECCGEQIRGSIRLTDDDVALCDECMDALWPDHERT